MRKIQLVVLLLWVFHFASFATNQDSLLQVYQNSPYDTARIDAAHELFKQTIRSDREKAVNYNQFIVATSERLNYGRGQMYGAYSQGVLAYLKGDFPTALQYYDQAAILAEATGNEPAQFVVDKASIYLVTGKLDTASQLLEAALEQLEMTNDYYNSLRATNNLGVIYSNQGNYEKALGVYQKAKKYAETIGDSSFIASFSVNIGNSYFNLGKNAEAIKNLLDAVEISENLKDDRAQAVALNTIGEQYLESNQPEKAITYLEKSRAIKQRLGLIPSFGRTLIFEGQAYFALDDKEMALKRINEAINLLEKANEVKGLASAYFTKSNILFASKQWEQGVVFLQKAEVTANEGQQT
ncbi:MAG: tetratricopeptide repeat protein, partial [Bacteroidota bacterium]